jgi:hypothetical protein
MIAIHRCDRVVAGRFLEKVVHDLGYRLLVIREQSCVIVVLFAG